MQPLNKLPYGSLNGKIAEGVIFLTYSSLISSSEKVSIGRIYHTLVYTQASFCCTSTGGFSKLFCRAGVIAAGTAGQLVRAGL